MTATRNLPGYPMQVKQFVHLMTNIMIIYFKVKIPSFFARWLVKADLQNRDFVSGFGILKENRNNRTLCHLNWDGWTLSTGF